VELELFGYFLVQAKKWLGRAATQHKKFIK